MARNINLLFNLNKGLINNMLCRNTIIKGTGIRYVFSEQALGLNGYERTRQMVRAQFMNVEDTFRNKMENVCTAENSTIFMEDLKAILHIAQKSDRDLTLLKKMIERFTSQSSQYKYGTFVFGPVIMRTLYYLDEPRLAYDLYCNSNINKFFDQISSQTILMCLLYKHEMYPEVLDVWEKSSATIENTGAPAKSTTILFATLYKNNTPQALEKAEQVWNKLYTKDTPLVSHRAMAYYIGLLLKQNQPRAALDILGIMPTHIVVHHSFHILALLQLKMYSNINELLTLMVNGRGLIFRDVYDELLHIEEDNPVISELKAKLTVLLERNRVKSVTLEDFICAPINVRTRQTDQNNPPRRDFKKNLMQRAF